MKHLVGLLVLSILCTSAALADDEKTPHHHDALNETQLGTVHFPISCDASVQKPFERGVALLHSFWYEEAEKEFVDIARDDPHCAMAHWGIAMSLWHQLWNEPDAESHRPRSRRSETGEDHRRPHHSARAGLHCRYRRLLQRFQES